MIKLNRRVSLVVVSALFALLASGCSNKANVEYKEDVSKNTNTKESKEPVKNTKNTELLSKLSHINVVTSTVDGKDIDLQSVHFAFDKFNLSDDMRIITKTNYKIISPLVMDHKNLKIKLEGNCDEWGTDEYNYALGLKRAKTIKDALVSDGIPAEKIILVTFGESNPLCSDKSENCWKKNRRTDYRLLP